MQSAKTERRLINGDQSRSKIERTDDGPRWPPVNLANNSFDGARSGSPQFFASTKFCDLGIATILRVLGNAEHSGASLSETLSDVPGQHTTAHNGEQKCNANERCEICNPPYASLAAMFKTTVRHFDCVINRGY